MIEPSTRTMDMDAYTDDYIDDYLDSEEEDEEDLMDHAVLPSTSRISPGKDRNAMSLTEEERGWALALRQAVQDCEELDSISDFECAQFAIVCKGDLPMALQRIYGMQLFRSEYKINNTVDQALPAFVEHFRQYPGYILHLDVGEDDTEPIGVLDLGSFAPHKTLETPAQGSNRHPDYNWQVDATRNYYQNYIMTPNLAAIRQGVFMIIDCDGIGWDNFSVDYSQRLHSELWGHQGVRFKNLLCYNTGSVANVCWNMIKHLMDSNMRESLQLGCQLDEGDDDASAQMPQRLSELYLQPSVQVAQEKMLERLVELMQVKQQNESAFRL